MPAGVGCLRVGTHHSGSFHTDYHNSCGLGSTFFLGKSAQFLPKVLPSFTRGARCLHQCLFKFIRILNQGVPEGAGSYCCVHTCLLPLAIYSVPFWERPRAVRRFSTRSRVVWNSVIDSVKTNRVAAQGEDSWWANSRDGKHEPRGCNSLWLVFCLAQTGVLLMLVPACIFVYTPAFYPARVKRCTYI